MGLGRFTIVRFKQELCDVGIMPSAMAGCLRHGVPEALLFACPGPMRRHTTSSINVGQMIWRRNKHEDRSHIAMLYKSRTCGHNLQTIRSCAVISGKHRTHKSDPRCSLAFRMRLEVDECPKASTNSMGPFRKHLMEFISCRCPESERHVPQGRDRFLKLVAENQEAAAGTFRHQFSRVHCFLLPLDLYTQIQIPAGCKTHTTLSTSKRQVPK